MGFFTKDAAPTPAAGSLAPISKDRIKAALEGEGWSYSVDSDGDIGGGWEYGSFFFLLNGEQQEIFSIRGGWRGQLAHEEFARALEICNAWNTEKLWPKTYARIDDEGAVQLYTEHNVDFEQGIEDGQLKQQLICAINTSMMFFEHLNETFPEAWEKYKPEA